MLSIVSTPIGNLGDITERARRTITDCSAIVCEDTRVTGKLLELLGFPKKELLSFHSYTGRKKIHDFIERLKQGQHLVLVSDAGTPGISDPGYSLVAAARDAGIRIEVIPGPSAFLAALSISGLPINEFVYLGFLPVKKNRRAILEGIRNEHRTVVFYESPHRIEKTLKELVGVLSDQPMRMVVICRELTKMHEEIIGTTVGDMLHDVMKELKIKGEFCVVLGPI
ncbi:MAG TPA: 16S rRNA (cytidine(1402)-2'-O)-methyltransferase [Candidatus Peribacterales bacterium]|nr:16S rRNA (cytidine(1402)-2'-O)-methyltransferase [Candidatus Peribacterales bacterium]